MCEDHGPKPSLLAVLDAREAVVVTVDDRPVAQVASNRAKLPVVTYPAGQVDCVLAPPEPSTWTQTGGFEAGARIAFQSANGAVEVPALSGRHASLLEGRSPDGQLVRLRVQPRA